MPKDQIDGSQFQYKTFAIYVSMYPYFLHHPGQIHQLSDVCVSQAAYTCTYWFQLCLAFIQIIQVELQCILSSVIVATEHFHDG